MKRPGIQNAVRIGITIFVLLLLTVVSLGFLWTSAHHPPALRAASHTVLGISALSGIFAVARIWRSR